MKDSWIPDSIIIDNKLIEFFKKDFPVSEDHLRDNLDRFIEIQRNRNVDLVELKDIAIEIIRIVSGIPTNHWAQNQSLIFQRLIVPDYFEYFTEIEQEYYRRGIKNTSNKLHRDHIMHSLRVSLLGYLIFSINSKNWIDEFLSTLERNYGFELDREERNEFHQHFMTRNFYSHTLKKILFLMFAAHDYGIILEYFQILSDRTDIDLLNPNFFRLDYQNNRNFEAIHEVKDNEYVYRGIFMNYRNQEYIDAFFPHLLKTGARSHDLLFFFDQVCTNFGSIEKLLDQINFYKNELQKFSEQSFEESQLNPEFSVKLKKREIFYHLCYCELLFAIAIHDKKKVFLSNPFFEILHLADEMQIWNRPIEYYQFEEHNSLQLFVNGDIFFGHNCNGNCLIELHSKFKKQPLIHDIVDEWEDDRFKNSKYLLFGDFSDRTRRDHQEKYQIKNLKNKIFKYKIELNDFNNTDQILIQASFNTADLAYCPSKFEIQYKI